MKVRAFAGLLIVLSAPSVQAQSDTVRVRLIDTVKVTGRADDLTGIATSASEGRVGIAELRLRPRTREGELLEAVPGLIVTQHSGDGKANQYFVRGFNLDHGTDFRTALEGMPINLPSHGHGQGYTDLNFLIPEFVEHLDYKLGVHHAETGDFGSAGAADFQLVRRMQRPFTSAEFGANGLAPLVGGGSRSVGRGTLLVGGEAKRYDGPWELAQDIRKFSALTRYSVNTASSQFSLLALAYNNRWKASDQIPERAVSEGIVSRFGYVDSTDGGASRRYSVSGSWRHLAATSTQLVQLYAVHSDLELFSNFTYFLDDPIRGDQFSQTDRRSVLGANATHAQAIDRHTLTVGVQLRSDIIDGVGLYRTERRARFATVRQDDVHQSSAGVHASTESRWSDRWRTVAGVRADGFVFAVTSDRAENSGRRTASIVSPKASIIFAPTANNELYVSGGFGFHSNDARGTTIGVDPLVRSRGAELGLRSSAITGVRSTLSAWMLNLDSELLFKGDAGSTEPSAASRRRGVTVANFYRPVPGLSIDLDVSSASARFVGLGSGQEHIPGALENVVAAGVTYSPGRDEGVLGAMRLRRFGTYLLVADNTSRARASSLVNAEAGYQLLSGTRLQLSVLNLLNARADDIQYSYASRLRGETSDGVDDVHFHPAEPRQVRIAVAFTP